MAYIDTPNGAMPIIHAGNAQQFINPTVDGETKICGTIPRPPETRKAGYYATMAPPSFTVLSQSEAIAAIAEKDAAKSWLSDIRMTAGPNGGPIPSRDQNGYGYCLPPGTLIRMADGSQKRIEDVRLLDEVLSAEGNVRRVMQCHVREHAGELVKVKAWGHGHLRMTPNHSVLTRRGYVPAGELTADDWIVAPRYAPCKASLVQTAEHVRAARRVLIGGQEVSPDVYNDVPDFVQLTPGVGRIFGLWLAEGYTEGGKTGCNAVHWSFGAHETDTLAAELVDLLQKEWGVEARTYPGPGPNVTIVTIYGKLWAQLFRSLCGALAGGKRLHADLMNGPRDFLEALFWGWMDGDGCRRETPRRATFYCGATISHNLAMNLYDIANFLGLAPSLCRERPQQNRHAKTRQPIWKIKVIPAPSDYRTNYRAKVEDKATWRKVYRVEREAYTGTVYNIGVDVDNSYVAESVGVHNCWAHSGVSAHLLARARMGQPYADLSAFAIACQIKNFADEGGWGPQGLDWQVKNGCPTSATWAQKSMSRSNVNPAMQAESALHKLTAQIADMDAQEYNRNLAFMQYVTLWIRDCPTTCDFSFWSHSVCGCRATTGSSHRLTTRSATSHKLLRIDEFDDVWAMDNEATGGISTVIWNSWGDSWSAQGMGVLTGNHAIPDAGAGILSVMAS